MVIDKNEKRTVLDSFEEKYVGFYRWLLLIIGMLSLLGFMALVGSLVWSTSHTPLSDASDYFRAPSWTELRREILPLRMKLQEAPAPEKETKKEVKEVVVDSRVRSIRENLLASFTDEQLEEANLYFSVRLLNEWLMVEVPIPTTKRGALIDELVIASEQIGSDDRIGRIGSVEGRSSVLMESIEKYVSTYLDNLERAERFAFSVQSEEDERKRVITSQLLIAIPIAAGIFLSMIGLILLIRMELHLRKFSSDYREVNLGR